jgi:hypothetical protein
MDRRFIPSTGEAPERSIRGRQTEAMMILIGQYDSPFVRRVAIALHLYGMAF